MLLLKTRYQVRLGETTELPADAATLAFLLHAKSRRVTTGDRELSGLVVAPNGTNDGIVLAASSKVTPGEYAVSVEATAADGETRQTNATIEVQPRVTVPKSSTRPPVVLLNGWQLGVTGGCQPTSTSANFGNLANYLVSDGVPVVYLFDNCVEDAGQSIETLGIDLASFLQTIKYDDGTQVQQIDLVGFSLGGLIARAYLAGLQPSGVYLPPSNTLVRKLVLIATPNFGSFLAGNVVAAIRSDPQASELAPGSAFLWNVGTWNQRGDDLHGVDAIAIIGNAGAYANVFTNQSVSNGSDGVVSLTSGSLGFVSQKASLTRIVSYCHVDSPSFTNSAYGTFPCTGAGIANVTSTSHLTGRIVRSFLAGTSDWSSIGTTPDVDQYLATNGATLFAMQSKGGGYVTDMTSVTWGTVSMVPGGNSGTLFYTDFATGTGQYTSTSTSLGKINCGTLAVSVGYTAPTRCKIGTALVSVTPLSTSAGGRAVVAGGAITLTGAFGSQCGNCKVLATPANSTTSQQLTITSWSSDGKTIVAQLPSSLTGFFTLTVNAVPGNDAMGIWAVSSTTISAAPSTLSYAYTTGGSLPADQSISIGGSLAWTATVSDNWLSLSATSGTAPSTVTVTAMPALLSPGTYNGTIQISATGATNSPQTVSVTLVVTGAPPSLVVAPQSLAFQYAAGAAVPAAQTLSIANGGSGSLAWTAASSTYWALVSPASGSAPGTLTVAVMPGNLAPGSYTANVTITPGDTTIPPVSIPVTIAVTGAPPAGTITGVANAASYAANFASATWVAIAGTNLSQVTYTWQASDIVNGALPKSIADVSVTINGVPAYIYYVSPTQINVLAPDDQATGSVHVQVTTGGQPSNSFTAQKTSFSPAFPTFDSTHVIAQHLDYSLVGAPGLLPNESTTPAKPGETIVLYGFGFGPANPAQPTGQVGTAPALANSVQISIGGTGAQVLFAGLAGPGLYQFNVVVPAALADGDASVVATIGGVNSQTGAAITIQHGTSGQ